MAAAQSSWKPWRWVTLELVLTMRDIYINSNLNPITKFTSSSRSTEFKDILAWDISQMIMKTVPISTRIVISYGMKQCILLWIWWKVIGNWNNTWSEFPNREKAILEQILVLEERNKSKRAGLKTIVWDPSRKVNHLGKVIWDRKIITEFTRSTIIG